MFNPFLLQALPPERPGLFTDEEEKFAHHHGRVVTGVLPHGPGVSLYIGKLLIRMGARLAKQDIEFKASTEHA